MKTAPLVEIMIALKEAELAEFAETIKHSRFDVMFLATAPEEWVHHAELMQRVLEYGAAMPALYRELATPQGKPSSDNKTHRLRYIN